MDTGKMTGTTTLMHCHYCESWQVDFTDAVAFQWWTLVLVNGIPEADGAAWYDLLDDLVHEHLLECPDF